MKIHSSLVQLTPYISMFIERILKSDPMLQVEVDKNQDTKRYVAIKKVFPLLHLKHGNIVKYPIILWLNGEDLKTVVTLDCSTF